MVRKCSECGNVGHNSRTCSNMQKEKKNRGRFKLFGVQLDGRAALPSAAAAAAAALLLKKSVSLDCLPSSSSSNYSSTSSSEKLSSGYLSSDGLITKPHERKKGVPWNEEEHKAFVVGLEKLGKGDWRGISRKFVTTRTPTQVASHAQKYFLRLTSLNKRAQPRSNLFNDAGGRDKFRVQVVESSSNSKPINNKNKNNLQSSSSISFGIIPSNYSSTPINYTNNIKLPNYLNNDHHQHHNSALPIWFGYDQDQPLMKFVESPIIKSSAVSRSSISNSHFQALDLQLSLSTATSTNPKPVDQEQADQPCCRTIAINNGPISVT